MTYTNNYFLPQVRVTKVNVITYFQTWKIQVLYTEIPTEIPKIASCKLIKIN